MSENTKIEWADHTFNPWEGCQKVGPGCDNCYAETRNARFAGGQAINWGPGAPRRLTSPANWYKPIKWNNEAFFQCECGWRGLSRDLDNEPSNILGVIPACPECNRMDFERARQRVFCASLADVFDNEVNPEWRAELLMLIRATPNLDWLLLTKRPGNVLPLLREAEDVLKAQDRLDGWEWLHDWTSGSPPHNVWLGATIVNQEEADRDIPKLLDVPARVRFLSMEPLLGSVELSAAYLPCPNADEMTMDPETGAYECCKRCDYTGVSGDIGIDWVIVGGESGPGARPMSPDWARSLRDHCSAAGVPFLFKQWGEWLPMLGQKEAIPVGKKVTTHDGWVMGWAGKKAAGRLLDGKEHNGFPEVQS